MSLKKMPRIVFESIDKENFFYEQFENSEELIYWRKKYDIDEWFFGNTIIYEECSDEITKEKLEKLEKWLIEKELKDDSDKIKEIIDKTDFKKYVIFYEYSC